MLVVHLASLCILVVHTSTLVVLFTPGYFSSPFGRPSRPRFSIGSVYTQFYRYPESEKAKYPSLSVTRLSPCRHLTWSSTVLRRELPEPRRLVAEGVQGAPCAETTTWGDGDIGGATSNIKGTEGSAIWPSTTSQQRHNQPTPDAWRS